MLFRKLPFFGLLFITSVISLLFLSCKKSPIEPEQMPPGSREYVWTIDTINTAPGDMLYLSRIWGSDPENVWAIGLSAPSLIGIWHYDGRKWSTDSLSTILNPYGIYGFGRNDAWIGDVASSFWRCTDSKTWRKFGTYSLPDYPNIVIQNIWGLSANDVFAVGYAENMTTSKYKCKMLLMHFDGKSWKFINTPDLMVTLLFIRKQIESDVYILVGDIIDSQDGTIFKVYSFDGKEFKELYSGRDMASINDMNGEVYIDIGQQIYKYKDGHLAPWKDLRHTGYCARVWGRNESDFFYFSNDGLGHYNGTDCKTLLKTSFDPFEAVIFDKEVFFLAHDDKGTNKSLVIHGRLKEEQKSKEK